MVLPNSLSSYYEKFLATGEVKCIDEEIPFEIPQGWEWCRLKHMCSMQAGKNIIRVIKEFPILQEQVIL